QPECPAPGYLWTPGYWAYGPEGYYWVPGTWVEPPTVGVLWTPGYWGWRNGFYVWHGGYWGPHVGFYGGINYGYGYSGVGFEGGEWRGREFVYNACSPRTNEVLRREMPRVLGGFAAIWQFFPRVYRYLHAGQSVWQTDIQ